MKRATYICLEGTEGVGKTTQTQKLVDYLRAKGYSVLQTKEPGTPLIPLTMILRGIMLDKQYDDVLTIPARELISQAIRSIHLERLIIPNLHKYDFIIQDRGILSGLAYGSACGNSVADIDNLIQFIMAPAEDKVSDRLYDNVVYLKGDVSAGLSKASQAKQEFTAGDAIEAKGNDFMAAVASNFDEMYASFDTHTVCVDDKNVEQVFTEILQALNIKGNSNNGQ